MSIEILAVVLWVVAVLITLCAVAYAGAVLHGENRRRMFAVSYGAVCDCAGGVGISAICVDAESAERVAELLHVEYERYELIVTVDSSEKPELLRELTERYGLVKVDYRPSGELFASEVRALYRSRSRRFRRLVVLDVISIVPETDADAALGVSVYDYAVQVGSGTSLLPYAVEYAVSEICSAPEMPHEVYAATGADLTIYLRDDVVAGGGFSSCARHFCRRRDRLAVYGVLAAKRVSRRKTAGIVVFAAATFVCGGIAAAITNVWPLVAVAVMWTTVAAAVLCAISSAAYGLYGRSAFAYTLSNFFEKTALKILD